MGSLVTGVGLSLSLLFIFPKILNFYGISMDVYGPYLVFTIFILVSLFILPHDFNSILTQAD